jgi:hypothetical protein
MKRTLKKRVRKGWNAMGITSSTNHAAAFTQGLALFDPASTKGKVMVMFTDGVTTAGNLPNSVATLAKAQGVIHLLQMLLYEYGWLRVCYSMSIWNTHGNPLRLLHGLKM